MRLKGGSYKDVHGAATKLGHMLPDGTRIECHHLFPVSTLEKTFGLDPEEGPTVQLPAEAHVEETETYGLTPRAFRARAAIERTLRAAQYDPAHIDVAWERAVAEIRALGPEYADALAGATAHYQQSFRPTLEAAAEAMRLVSQEVFERAVTDLPAPDVPADPGAQAGEDLGRQLDERARELGRLLPDHTLALGQLRKPGEVAMVAACQGRPLSEEQKEVLQLMGFKLLKVAPGDDPSATILGQTDRGYEVEAVGSQAPASADHTIDTRAISVIGHPAPSPESAPSSTVDLPVPPVRRSPLDELEWSVAKLAARVESEAARLGPAVEARIDTSAIKVELPAEAARVAAKVGEGAASVASKVKNSVARKIGGIGL